MVVYHPLEQEIGGGRVFVARAGGSLRAGADHHADHSRPVARAAVEQAATLDDIRSEVLAPDRLNALVFGVFAAVALTIAVVGVRGVLRFRSARGRASSASAWRSGCSPAVC